MRGGFPRGSLHEVPEGGGPHIPSWCVWGGVFGVGVGVPNPPVGGYSEGYLGVSTVPRGLSGGSQCGGASITPRAVSGGL